MIYVEKKHLTLPWPYYWITGPGHAEHSACDGKYHCFGCVRWHTNAPVWIVGKKRGVHVCESRLCEPGGDRARGRGLTLWEPHSVEWTTVSLGSVLSSGRKRGYWALSGKKNFKKSLGLRKRAIKPGASWFREKLCENNSVSAQPRASDVSWSNGNLSAGSNSWPLTSAFGKPWQLLLTWAYRTKGQSELVTAEQRQNVNFPDCVGLQTNFLLVNLRLIFQRHQRMRRYSERCMFTPVLVCHEDISKTWRWILEVQLTFHDLVQ